MAIFKNTKFAHEVLIFIAFYDKNNSIEKKAPVSSSKSTANTLENIE